MDQSKKQREVRTDVTAVKPTGVAGGRNGSPEGYEGHGTAHDAVEAPNASARAGAPAERTGGDGESDHGALGGAAEKASEPTE